MAEKFSVIFLLSPFSFLTFFVIKIFHLSTRNRKKEPLTQNKRFLGPKIAREIEFCRQEKLGPAYARPQFYCAHQAWYYRRGSLPNSALFLYSSLPSTLRKLIDVFYNCFDSTYGSAVSLIYLHRSKGL